MVIARVPENIDDNVIKLAKRIGSKEPPIYIEILTESYAKLDECFDAVEKKIKCDGGSMVLGWRIWERPKILIEAEFHAIWKSPDNKLIDICPKLIDTDKILFITDPRMRNDGATVDNIRISISNNRLVNDFIRTCEAIYHINNKGERAYQREVVLSEEESDIHNNLELTMSLLFDMIEKGLTRNSLCFCGSGQKYKHCHSYELERLIGKSRILTKKE
jgi:hypothetical protein